MKVKDVQHGKTTRKSFARIEEILEMPNLIEVQKKSYEWFLDQGLRAVFRDVDCITDYAGNLELSFIGWYLLSGLTFGLLAIFYVNPYVYLTKAGCFNEYLNDALSRNVIDMSELRVNG